MGENDKFTRLKFKTSKTCIYVTHLFVAYILVGLEKLIDHRASQKGGSVNDTQ